MPVKAQHPGCFTLRQTAKMFGVSLTWLRNFMARHKIPCFRIDGRTIVLTVETIRCILQIINRKQQYRIVRKRLKESEITHEDIEIDMRQPEE